MSLVNPAFQAPLEVLEFGLAGAEDVHQDVQLDQSKESGLATCQVRHFLCKKSKPFWTKFINGIKSETLFLPHPLPRQNHLSPSKG